MHPSHRGCAIRNRGNRSGKSLSRGTPGGVEGSIGFLPRIGVRLMAVDPFAELLRHLRRNANRTQDDQAGAINAASGRATMTRREVNRYENGANVPTDHTLANIALACGVSLEPLLREAKAARARRREKYKAEAAAVKRPSAPARRERGAAVVTSTTGASRRRPRTSTPPTLRSQAA
ncbi:helix-turn-helix domain-containing protein [Streptomyces sp. NPDC058375]|uniref:helix-turn-helix domain-containing protein n=1 Tax=Streptomyces sp. NPDC058375 TaxID=3346467 RepID=UPI003661C499